MPTSLPRPGLTLLAGLALFAADASAAVKVEEKTVGPTPGNPPSYVLSPHGVHVASLTMKGSRSFVVVDGVEGPAIDELLTVNGGQSYTCVNAVLFSPDGTSHAYAARAGDQYLVVRDGKEIYRGPFENRAMAGFPGQLTMSPGGKHVWFTEKVDLPNSQHGWRFVVDGKPGPLSSNNNSFRMVISPDDSRWAYTAAKHGGARDEMMTVIDGKEVAHRGHFIRFTGDNRLVTLAPGPDGLWALSVDGKALTKSVTDAENRVWLSPTGHRVAAAIRKAPGTATLWIDGKEVDATEGAKDIASVTFSPDGKRYLAVCQTVAAHFAVVDGKKQTEYRLIAYPQFTADSSRALYVATAGNRSFVITDGQESDGFEMIGGQYVKFATPVSGPRFAYSTGDGMNRTFSLVADAKPIPLNGKSPAHDTLTFSANGAAYALAAAPVGRSEITSVLLNGEEVPDFRPYTILLGAPNTARREAYFVLSPDGRRIATSGLQASTNRRGLYVNNRLLHPTERMVTRVAFTPDSNHVFWTVEEARPGTPVPVSVVYADGVKAVELPSRVMNEAGCWEMASDGVYRFIAMTDKGIQRYEVTADSDNDVDKAVAATEAAEAQRLADAEAAQKKAQEDALAAKQQQQEAQAAAAAKAKADREAAIAKRKADLEAKTKARADAIEAKKKAKQQNR